MKHLYSRDLNIQIHKFDRKDDKNRMNDYFLIKKNLLLPYKRVEFHHRIQFSKKKNNQNPFQNILCSNEYWWVYLFHWICCMLERIRKMYVPCVRIQKLSRQPKCYLHTQYWVVKLIKFPRKTTFPVFFLHSIFQFLYLSHIFYISEKPIIARGRSECKSHFRSIWKWIFVTCVSKIYLQQI